MSVIQKVSNWLLGEYPVRATQIGSGATRALVQHVQLVDEDGNYVNAANGGGGGGGGGALAGDGRKVVASAGTAEAIAASTTATRVIITAETDNTDLVVVGRSTVVAALGTRQGIPLSPGQTIELNVSNLSNVYIDSLVNGEGVTFVYEA